jgi:hypothetical protein
MFEDINRRLSDDTFLQQAIDASDVEMTEEDASAPAPSDKPNDAVFD